MTLSFIDEMRVDYAPETKILQTVTLLDRSQSGCAVFR
jgi:hypothetical protein